MMTLMDMANVQTRCLSLESLSVPSVCGIHDSTRPLVEGQVTRSGTAAIATLFYGGSKDRERRGALDYVVAIALRAHGKPGEVRRTAIPYTSQTQKTRGQALRYFSSRGSCVLRVKLMIPTLVSGHVLQLTTRASGCMLLSHT